MHDQGPTRGSDFRHDSDYAETAVNARFVNIFRSFWNCQEKRSNLLLSIPIVRNSAIPFQNPSARALLV